MNLTLHIFKKELRDMFRDKRVRSMAFFTPVMMIVMFLFIFGFLQNTMSKPNSMKVHVVKGHPEITQIIRGGKMNAIEIDSMAQGLDMIKKGDARVVIDSPTSEPPGKNLKPMTITAHFDPKQEMSQLTVGVVQKTFAAYNQQLLKVMLKANGLPETAAEPIKVDTKEVVVGGKGGAGQLLIGILPYLIVIWAFYGGMSIASDLVAGEKEKNTLETLLIAPASRTQIAVGKFLSLCVICLVSSLSSFVGLAVIEALHLPMTKGLFPGGLGISFLNVVEIVGVLVPTVALFASLLLALSTFARNPREAQSYLAGLSFLILMPAMMSQFIGYTDFANARWLYAIPVLNTATVLRNVLQAKPDGVGFLITVTVSLVLAVIGIRVAVMMFQREEVLTRV